MDRPRWTIEIFFVSIAYWGPPHLKLVVGFAQKLSTPI